MSSNKRLQKELQENAANPLPGCTIEPNESDMNIWNVYMEGPADSVYVGGRFHIQVTLPKEYPFKPPVVAFRTKIYHPNVSNDDKGAMCLGMLKAEEWKPPNKIADVLKLVKAVLSAPQPDDAIETTIAEQYKNDFKGFEKEAKMWTSKYAN
ncbi:Ubiquitin-conjugating enzyme E2 5A [Fulvia fulva]|uniref:E2 ubiquitin-conjugating enzyme n=1 Tax=Passalora fulva TaxID=5499 RepID=A0A9Q8PCL2_PASFU|nr:Ubiquitin-conjugating enzyme E2 5A [Fulvia fulva]KAK4620079.1 Ubiquitin-conjugating enzyme E2 5A [Fulvia fulva]KAK4621190.1 Ubiquitin-conjugating enzyme E2 5A [Fulvia fulva]UJO20046.1 Ubiquitin-conjugating enzyme E2 5A [Fulvia fulva]WPV17696.1 Ubiquitin-conjugating enzyme E2 5A [Fulvia fulva]WPV32479.1 Ubiquitin-conjugating enzyme E2 5A [Fulvia fulva]